jgi:hypothetical protein
MRNEAASLWRSLPAFGQYQWELGGRGGNADNDEEPGWLAAAASAASGRRKLNTGKRSVSFGGLASSATLARMSSTSFGDGPWAFEGPGVDEDGIVPVVTAVLLVHGVTMKCGVAECKGDERGGV